MDTPGLVLFDVAAQDDGGFSAYARVGGHSMLTRGETLEELRTMIIALIDDYNICEATRIESYALIFSAGCDQDGTQLNLAPAPQQQQFGSAALNS